MSVLTGTITGTGVVGAVGARQIHIYGAFNLSLRAFGVATVALERSFNDTDWGVVEEFTENAEKIGDEPKGAVYRLNCTAYTSGTIAYHLGN